MQNTTESRPSHSFLFVRLLICFVLFTKFPVFSTLVSEKQKSQRIQWNEVVKPMTHVMIKNLAIYDTYWEETDDSFEGGL